MKLILLLEDDPSSLSVLNWVFERDYRVLSTDDPEEAIRLSEVEVPDLLVADNLLKASLSGIETVCQIHKRRPEMPFLIISGTPPEGWPDIDFDCFAKLIKSARFSFLQKPFTSDALREISGGLMNGDSQSLQLEMMFTKAAAHRGSQESWRVRFSAPGPDRSTG